MSKGEYDEMAAKMKARQDKRRGATEEQLDAFVSAADYSEPAPTPKAAEKTKKVDGRRKPDHAKGKATTFYFKPSHSEALDKLVKRFAVASGGETITRSDLIVGAIQTLSGMSDKELRELGMAVKNSK